MLDLGQQFTRDYLWHILGIIPNLCFQVVLYLLWQYTHWRSRWHLILGGLGNLWYLFLIIIIAVKPEYLYNIRPFNWGLVIWGGYHLWFMKRNPIPRKVYVDQWKHLLHIRKAMNEPAPIDPPFWFRTGFQITGLVGLVLLLVLFIIAKSAQLIYKASETFEVQAAQTTKELTIRNRQQAKQFQQDSLSYVALLESIRLDSLQLMEIKRSRAQTTAERRQQQQENARLNRNLQRYRSEAERLRRQMNLQPIQPTPKPVLPAPAIPDDYRAPNPSYKRRGSLGYESDVQGRDSLWARYVEQ
ncbi:hypothetical protein DYU11_20085 [Fibrisoma montanum]|uniref:Uncharacterized protein n=1 Tax=Fibrisoma montanum TaxID=2305895 RepID=A0A418M3Y0_9BACT|nr:hypothetical protein [Fibrisoma montanum]RIV20353.1 hypothetical protein DYU11_20085 [Fibrisoma montanum]